MVYDTMTSGSLESSNALREVHSSNFGVFGVEPSFTNQQVSAWDGMRVIPPPEILKPAAPFKKSKIPQYIMVYDKWNVQYWRVCCLFAWASIISS